MDRETENGPSEEDLEPGKKLEKRIALFEQGLLRAASGQMSRQGQAELQAQMEELLLEEGSKPGAEKYSDQLEHLARLIELFEEERGRYPLSNEDILNLRPEEEEILKGSKVGDRLLELRRGAQKFPSMTVEERKIFLLNISAAAAKASTGTILEGFYDSLLTNLKKIDRQIPPPEEG